MSKQGSVGMESILTALIILVSCPVGMFIGWVMAFAAVRAAGYRLKFSNSRWSVTRLPVRGQTGTMRSVN